jgi:hypothetical protein
METTTTQLSLENSKCQTWEDEYSLLKCCKEELTDILKKSIECTIAGMEVFFPDNKTFLECQTNENAKVTYTKSVEILSEFYLDFWKNSCLAPMEATIMKFSISTKTHGMKGAPQRWLIQQ